MLIDHLKSFARKSAGIPFQDRTAPNADRRLCRRKPHRPHIGARKFTRCIPLDDLFDTFLLQNLHRVIVLILHLGKVPDGAIFAVIKEEKFRSLRFFLWHLILRRAINQDISQIACFSLGTPLSSPDDFQLIEKTDV